MPKGVPVDIKATSTATGIAGNAQLTVTDAAPAILEILPVTVPNGTWSSINLKVIYSDGSWTSYNVHAKNLTFSTGDTSIATVTESIVGYKWKGRGEDHVNCNAGLTSLHWL